LKLLIAGILRPREDEKGREIYRNGLGERKISVAPGRCQHADEGADPLGSRL
jgi:hypothetical protein